MLLRPIFLKAEEQGLNLMDTYMVINSGLPSAQVANGKKYFLG
jgi:hypothetical protein